MRFLYALAFLCLVIVESTYSQDSNLTASELHHEIQKLNFLGSALYVAAHPDDENQRLISYLSNKVKARTAYLSITRGDGGQNLIGPELKELLGVLRTQELLAARSIDGGEQRFTRAIDFGYSKHPDETLSIWNKKEVLGDVVWTIRNFKPDIIINRFDHRSPGSTHGHHTSSAMLSYEAFDIAGNENTYPDQLKMVEPWQPKRLFFNTSWWFYGSRENFENADKTNLASVDIGVYYPQLGQSNNEIAAMARSQHRCQGFGQMTARGTQNEYAEFLKGNPLNDKSNLFDGINTTWSRVEGGKKIGDILNAVEKNFNYSDPSVHIPDLVRAYTELQLIDDDHWKSVKSEHLKEIILACAGIYLEANPETANATPGESISLNAEVVNRSGTPVKLNAISIGELVKIEPNVNLDENKRENFELSFKIPENKSYSSPYWLKEKGTLGMYAVNDQKLIGKPESQEAFTAYFELEFDGQSITFEKPVVHRYNRPDRGELFEPFAVLPKATVSIANDVILFPDSSAMNIPVEVRAGVDNVKGIVELNAPDEWYIEPKSIEITLGKKGETKSVNFKVTPPSSENQATLKAQITVAGKLLDKELVEIEYDHIPKQSVLLPAEAKIVRLDIKKEGNLIGYIEGAGDKVPESLTQIGYEVEKITVDEIQPDVLDKYDGIVMGIRAYNVLDGLTFKQPMLLDYVKNGGNLIVQYNTAGRWNSQFENIAPYPLTISRDRVTDEEAPVKIVAPDHPMVNTPNAIKESDFNGWVQERGLYFPNQWDDQFTPILSMADKGAPETQGSLLVAPYGKGNYIYTGLSFFRELPAGVPGAYKLFANMLSLKNSTDKSENNVRGKR